MVQYSNLITSLHGDTCTVTAAQVNERLRGATSELTAASEPIQELMNTVQSRTAAFDDASKAAALASEEVASTRFFKGEG